MTWTACRDYVPEDYPTRNVHPDCPSVTWRPDYLTEIEPVGCRILNDGYQVRTRDYRPNRCAWTRVTQCDSWIRTNGIVRMPLTGQNRQVMILYRTYLPEQCLKSKISKKMSKPQQKTRQNRDTAASSLDVFI